MYTCFNNPKDEGEQQYQSTAVGCLNLYVFIIIFLYLYIITIIHFIHWTNCEIYSIVRHKTITEYEIY